MRELIMRIGAWAGVVMLAAVLAAAPEAAGSLPVTADQVPLRGATAEVRRLSEFNGRVLVIVFLGVDCPISNRYAAPLAELAARYRSCGVAFAGINANPGEAADRVTRHATEFAFGFPVLKDETQALADALQARVTPEAFVLDAERLVRYRGRIDDSYPARGKERRAARHDLRDALEAVLAGRAVPRPVTSAVGCTLARTANGNAEPALPAGLGPTFHRDVLPVLQERCQSCHRPGQVGPFALLTYADATRWAKGIHDAVASRRMPPWKPDPDFGLFEDARRLSEAEVATLVRWAEAGAPEGDPRDGRPQKQWAEGWTLGEPDLVLTMPEAYPLEATGPDEVRNFVLPTGLSGDRELVALDIRPGNPRVVHHVDAFADASGIARALDRKDARPGYTTGPMSVGFRADTEFLGGWTPGAQPRFLPQGISRLVPGGADVVLQVHYHKSGKPEADRTQVGLYFARKPAPTRLSLLALSTDQIEIPPNAAAHPIRASVKLSSDLRLWSVMAHMHLLGKSIKVTAMLPDGSVRPLLRIREWDYRWQDCYRFREPIDLPKGTRLEMEACFDNSAGNPLNPNDPPRRVRFGPETTDEMALAAFETTPRGRGDRGGAD